MISFLNHKWFFICLLIGASILNIQCGTDSDSDSEEERTWQPGDVYTDENGWLEARVGNMPLVISAPHGGTIQPDTIADRNCEGIVTVRDMNTTELAFQVEQTLKSE